MHTSYFLLITRDAAHSLHPLAGQGLNLGMGDAECLSKVIQDAVLNGQDIGQHYILEGYSRERYLHDVAILGVVDVIGKLFKGNSQLLGSIRTFGLSILDKSDFAKKLFMKIAA
jgi:ubiquinone biosynthesis monooxygenase Coq6